MYLLQNGQRKNVVFSSHQDIMPTVNVEMFEQTSSKSKMWLYIALLLCLTAIAVSGYFIYKKYKPKSKVGYQLF